MTDVPHTILLREGDDVRALRRRRLRLDVVRGPDKKQRVDLEGERATIGTHDECDLTLTDPTVSRQHFEIALVDGGYAIRDLDSLNGTWIDDMRIADVTVRGATTISVGSSRIKMTPLDTTVDVPLTAETRLGELRGRSPQMRRIFELLAKVAPTEATVLITGESGTGKEVAARTVHEHSRRAEGPFVVVDCAALPPTLIESELYGHERGAFTGADRARVGAFEAASGGTLFLDEIGELPLELQTRLLGVIERREVSPLGSARSRKIDVRLVAATNRDLRREVNRETFRADLYFRLAVVDVRMPALRERPEDIPLYVEAFVRDHADTGVALTIDAETIESLMKRPWPGNVRELRNVLERAAALGEVGPDASAGLTGPDPEETTLDDSGGPKVSVRIDPSVPFKTAKALLVSDYEHAYVRALMAAHDGNITQAARAAEIDRVYLLRLLDKFDMRPTRQRRD